MIDALKSEEIIKKVGGRFKLCALIQRRMTELMQGGRPYIDRKPGMTDMEVAVQEIIEEKIEIDYDQSDVPAPGDLK